MNKNVKKKFGKKGLGRCPKSRFLAPIFFEISSNLDSKNAKLLEIILIFEPQLLKISKKPIFFIKDEFVRFYSSL